MSDKEIKLLLYGYALKQLSYEYTLADTLGGADQILADMKLCVAEIEKESKRCE